MKLARAQSGKTRAVFDPRLALGLLLVAASVGGVVAIVSAADQTAPVYAARSALSPGDRLLPGDLDSRSVRLDATGSHYLVPGDLPASGAIVTRAVAAGELVPVSAVGDADGVRLGSVVLSANGQLAASVGPGSVVDVWSAKAVGGGFAPPVVIVAEALVVRLVESGSIVGSAKTTGVEVLVPRNRIARVLEAMANGSAISVVATSLPFRG